MIIQQSQYQQVRYQYSIQAYMNFPNQNPQMLPQPLISHQPPLTRQIEYRYNKSRSKQNQYEFPRKIQSVQSQSSNKSIPYHGYYNLYWQNRFNRRKQDQYGKQRIKVENKEKDKEKKDNHQFYKKKYPHDDVLQQNDLNQQKNVEKIRHTKILSLKELKRYQQRISMTKRQKIRITSRQNSPIRFATNNKYLQIEAKQEIINYQFLDFPTIKTPKKKEMIQLNSKSKGKGKRKIQVVSGKKIRRIEAYHYLSAPSSPRKGLEVTSKSKSNQKMKKSPTKQKKYNFKPLTKTINIF